MCTTRTYKQREFAPKKKQVVVESKQFGIKATAFLGVIS